MFLLPLVYTFVILTTNNRMAPSHYDPLEGMNRGSFPSHIRSHGPGSGLIPTMRADKYPRPCVRAIQSYKRCTMVNGEEKCENEQENILSICPRWALEGMVEKKKMLTKIYGLQVKQYRSAMEVSDYNNGREVSKLEAKTWRDGTREKLRPDTMWADDRYADITQTDINEAKVRHAARQAAKAEGHVKEEHHHTHYDWIEAKRREKAPLYP